MEYFAPLRILKASAGSGKTFSLTLHYLSLLLQDEFRYREILAVTFTNKATAEMKERILSVLQKLAIADNDRQTQTVREHMFTQFPHWSPEDIQHRAHRAYRRILHDYSHFTVSTIDGFSQKVIRSFTYELNLDSAYQIEMNTNKVKSDLTVMLNSLLDEQPDLLNWIINYAEERISNNQNWNYRQQLAKLAELIFSESFQEFNAYLATADTQQVFNLLNKEVSENTRAFLASFNQSIQAFQEVYQSSGVTPDLLKNKSRNPVVIAAKIRPEMQNHSVSDVNGALMKFLSLRDNEEAFTEGKSVRHDLIQQFAPVLERFTQLERLHPSYLAYEAVQANLYYLRLLKEMSDLLTVWRKENTAQLISDAQVLLNKLGLDLNNDPTFIWEKIGNRYNYFLFDEFQDTSRVQWKNYSPLLMNALSNAQGRQHEHLIVGDVKQSIYRWRNGDWRILLQQVEQQVVSRFNLNKANKSKFVQIDTLETNYRSLPRIIAFNNYLYARIPTLLQNVLNEKVRTQLSGERYQWWLEAHNDDMLIRAYENSTQQVPPHKLESENAQGSIEITYLPVENGRFRANQVRDASVENLCHKVGEWLSTGRYQPKQIGILVRSNKQALFVIEELLAYKNQQGLNFEVISGDVLTLASNDAILLIIETLRAFVYNSDAHTIFHARMAYLYTRIKTDAHFSSESWLKFKDNDIKSLASLLPAELTNNWERWKTLSVVHLVEKLIELYGLNTANQPHLPYILAFKDMVDGFAARGDRGITQFLTYWEEDGNTAVLPSNGKIDAIEVTTIHKSKGLAYDVVMLPFCAWGIDGQRDGNFWVNTAGTPFEQLGKIPLKYNGNLANSLFYQAYYEEMLFNYMDALNTLYVATTRAVEHIYITAPSFKQTTDKKNAGVTGLDIKNEYISDLLYQVLDDSAAPFPFENGVLCIDQPKERRTDKDTNNGSKQTSLDQYPLSDTLEKAWNETTERSINTILMMDVAAQYGVLAHEIMAEIKQESDIEKLVNSYIDTGILPHTKRQTLLQEIRQIWNHPKINSWLTGSYKIWNEAAIITIEGETIRPDKVFASASETIVLDFKFTNDNYQSHKKQVDQYIHALAGLGYQNVRGYLYYAKSNELVEVK